MTIQEVIAQAQKDKADDEERYGECSHYELDWYVDRVLRRMTTEDFVVLFMGMVSMVEFADSRLSSGYTIRRALMHDEVLGKLLDVLDKQ